MKIAYHPAPDRGVQQLMTVGEYGVVGATAPVEWKTVTPVATVFALGVVAGRTNGLFRLLAIGAAVVVGYNASR